MFLNRIARPLSVGAVALLACASNALAAGGDGVTGACCLPDGGCTVVDFIECEMLGGGYIGDGTDCATSDCENITGGCCLAEAFGGNCISVTFELCILKGGESWAPFVDCANACPGACCFNDGSPCTLLGQVDCEDFGGFFQGNGSTCDTTTCLPFGACCLPNGDCETAFEKDCLSQGGLYQGAGIMCDNVICPDPVGACCFDDGTCVETTMLICDADGGIYQGDLTSCVPNDCPQPPATGACCFPSGDCQVETQEDCENMGGLYDGDDTTCVPNDCPQPPATGACCLDSGVCDADVTEEDCEFMGGTWQGADSACTPNPCPQPPAPAACCFFDGTCEMLLSTECDDAGGSFQGEGTTCGTADCPELVLRASGTEKGSLLMFSKVEIQYGYMGPGGGQGETDGAGIPVIRDTYLQLTNDSPEPVRVLMYWVNGDAPNEGTTGWNYIDVEVTLTGNQTIYWSAATGEGTVTLPPFSVLNPGIEHGEMDGKGELGGGNLRGFIYAFAVDPVDGLEVKHNHLTGTGTIVDFYARAAAEYNALAYRRRTEAIGDGALNLDGDEYDESYAQLVLHFQAGGSSAWSSPMKSVAQATEVTLHPTSADFRPDVPGLPVTTKANYDVWNENEVKLSGAYRCITCWDATFLHDYGIPNHFSLQTLQTDHGRARIRGDESALCNGGGFVSEDAALAGVVVRLVSFDYAVPAYSGSGYDATAVNLIGIGSDPTAVVRYSPLDVPPESPEFAKIKRQRRGNGLSAK